MHHMPTFYLLTVNNAIAFFWGECHAASGEQCSPSYEGASLVLPQARLKVQVRQISPMRWQVAHRELFCSVTKLEHSLPKSCPSSRAPRDEKAGMVGWAARGIGSHPMQGFV